MTDTIHRFSALGTVCAVGVERPEAAPVAMRVVARAVADCDLSSSRFRSDSDLSRLNAGAGGYVPVSERLLDDLETALWAAELTDGIVDPTVGRALIALGYDRDFSLLARTDSGVEDGAGRLTLTSVPGWRAVKIDRNRRRARLPTGVMVDLGATAKARCADLAAEAAAAAAGCGVLVSLGGDVAFSGATPQGGWRVRVTDDAASELDAPGQTVALTTGALATSSVTVRTWSYHDMAMHHLVDPRTGWPAPVVWRTVTVVAATCTEANIASTASVILGPSAPAWLANQGLCARLVAADGTVHHVGAWPAEPASPVDPPAEPASPVDPPAEPAFPVDPSGSARRAG